MSPKVYQLTWVAFRQPRPCPECGTPAIKGKGEYGRPLEALGLNPEHYGHRYGNFCTMRCATNFANKILMRSYRPHRK